MRICIDPSNTQTGVAVFDMDWNLVLHDNLKAKSFYEYFCLVANLQKSFNCTHAYIELPAFQPSGKGLIAAKNGSLVKLAGVWGAITAACYGCETHQIKIIKWKGTIDGNIKYARILKEFAEKYPDVIPPKQDAIDAVGIGFWCSKQKF